MDKENLKAIFNDLGVASQGYVNKDELAKICEYFGMEDMTKKELDKLFQDLDQDKDGKISEDEFLVGMFNKPSPPTPFTPKFPSDSPQEPTAPVSSPAPNVTPRNKNNKTTPANKNNETTPTNKDINTTPTNKDDETTPTNKDANNTKSPSPTILPTKENEPLPPKIPSTKAVPDKNSPETDSKDSKFDSLPNFGDKNKFPNLSATSRADPTDWLNFLDPNRTGFVKGSDVIDYMSRCKIADGENILKRLNFDPEGNIAPSQLARVLEQQLKNSKDAALHNAAADMLLNSTDKLWKDNEDLVEECDRLNEEVEELKSNLKDADELLDAIEQKKEMEVKLLEEANQKLREELTEAKKQIKSSSSSPPPTSSSSSALPSKSDGDDFEKLKKKLEDSLKESMDECERLRVKNEELESEIKKLTEDLNNASTIKDTNYEATKKKLDDGEDESDNKVRPSNDRYSSLDFDDANISDDVRRTIQREMDRREKLAGDERKQAEGALLLEISELESKHADELEKLKKDHKKEKDDLLASQQRAIADAIAEKERDLMKDYVKDKLSSSASQLPVSSTDELDNKNKEITRLQNELEKQSKLIEDLQQQMKDDNNNNNNVEEAKPTTTKKDSHSSIIPAELRKFFTSDDDLIDDVKDPPIIGKDDVTNMRVEKEVKLSSAGSGRLETYLREQISDLCRQNAELMSRNEKMNEQLNRMSPNLNNKLHFSTEQLVVDKADVMAERDLLRDQLRRTLNQLNDVTTALTALTNQHRAEKQAWTLAKDQLIDPAKYQQLASKLAWTEAANEKLQALLERSQLESTNLLTAARESFDKSLNDLNKEKLLSDNYVNKLTGLIDNKDQRIKQFNDQQKKTEKLIKDLYDENARLVKYLQVLEKQKNDLNSTNKLLEDKCLALGDLVRRLCPAALQ